MINRISFFKLQAKIHDQLLLSSSNRYCKKNRLNHKSRVRFSASAKGKITVFFTKRSETTERFLCLNMEKHCISSYS